VIAVDDEQPVLDTIRRILVRDDSFGDIEDEFAGLDERLFGSKRPTSAGARFEIIAAKQGDDAVESVRSAIAEGAPFSVCFLDIRMPPGPDGVKTAEEIRKLDPDIIFVFLTAYSDYDPMAILKRVPPADKFIYMQKPFHPWEVWQFAVSLSTRWKMERQLNELRADLEGKVIERTSELEKLNVQLESELSKRIDSEKRILDYQQQLRMLASELVLAEEREKRRLAEILHDTVGHSISATQMKLALIIDAVSDAELRAKLESILKLSEETAVAIRNLTFEISPPVIKELGFDAALDWLADMVERRFGVRVAHNASENKLPWSEDNAMFAFRAVQELVVNAAKHSGTQGVNVSVSTEGSTVVIAVEDDGKGFDVAELQHHGGHLKGFGIFSIMERARGVGGELEVQSKPGHGTKALLRLPIDE
jgi:signal transduction histidine kinase